MRIGKQQVKKCTKHKLEAQGESEAGSTDVGASAKGQASDEMYKAKSLALNCCILLIIQFICCFQWLLQLMHHILYNMQYMF